MSPSVCCVSWCADLEFRVGAQGQGQAGGNHWRRGGPGSGGGPRGQSGSSSRAQREARDSAQAELSGPQPQPTPSGANKKSFPRGAPIQHLAPRRNSEG